MTRSTAMKQELTGDYSGLTVGPSPPPSRLISVSSTTTAMGDLGVDNSQDTAAADVDMDGATNGAFGSRLVKWRCMTKLTHSTGINTCPEPGTTANPSPRLGCKSRDLIRVIQKLDALGIDSTLPSLPKFVVVGDQSQGKSSIIEAICEITLPRGPGTRH